MDAGDRGRRILKLLVPTQPLKNVVIVAGSIGTAI